MRSRTVERVHRRVHSYRNAKEGDVRFYRAMHPSGMRYGAMTNQRLAGAPATWHPGGMRRLVEKPPTPLRLHSDGMHPVHGRAFLSFSVCLHCCLNGDLYDSFDSVSLFTFSLRFTFFFLFKKNGGGGLPASGLPGPSSPLSV
jgi:hypothetical protein